MNDWSGVFLGAIAGATVVMALIQVGIIAYGAFLARRVNRMVGRVEREIEPIMAHLSAVSRDAAKASAMAVSQLERADHALTNLSTRADQTLLSVQGTFAAPVREGLAVLSGLRAALLALRDMRERPSPRPGRTEDEDALFI